MALQQNAGNDWGYIVHYISCHAPLKLRHPDPPAASRHRLGGESGIYIDVSGFTFGQSATHYDEVLVTIDHWRCGKCSKKLNDNRGAVKVEKVEDFR